MKCPGCDFVCSELRDICPRCLVDLRGHKRLLGLPVIKPDASYKELCGRGGVPIAPKRPGIVHSLFKRVKRSLFESAKQTPAKIVITQSPPAPLPSEVSPTDQSMPNVVPQIQSTQNQSRQPVSSPPETPPIRISQWFDADCMRTQTPSTPESLVSLPAEETSDHEENLTEALDAEAELDSAEVPVTEDVFEIEPINADFSDDLSDVTALIKAADQIQHGEVLDYPDIADVKAQLVSAAEIGTPDKPQAVEPASIEHVPADDTPSSEIDYINRYEDPNQENRTLALSDPSHLDELVAQALEEALRAPKPEKPVQSDDLDLHFEFIPEVEDEAEPPPAGQRPSVPLSPIESIPEASTFEEPIVQQSGPTQLDSTQIVSPETLSQKLSTDSDDDAFLDIFERTDVIEIEESEEGDDVIFEEAAFDEEGDSAPDSSLEQSLHAPDPETWSDTEVMAQSSLQEEEAPTLRIISSLGTPRIPSIDESEWALVDSKLQQAANELKNQLENSLEAKTIENTGSGETAIETQPESRRPGEAEAIQDFSGAHTEAISHVANEQFEPGVNLENDSRDSESNLTSREEPLPCAEPLDPRFVPDLESLARVDGMLRDAAINFENSVPEKELPAEIGIEEREYWSSSSDSWIAGTPLMLESTELDDGPNSTLDTTNIAELENEEPKVGASESLGVGNTDTLEGDTTEIEESAACVSQEHSDESSAFPGAFSQEQLEYVDAGSPMLEQNVQKDFTESQPDTSPPSLIDTDQSSPQSVEFAALSGTEPAESQDCSSPVKGEDGALCDGIGGQEENAQPVISGDAETSSQMSNEDSDTPGAEARLSCEDDDFRIPTTILVMDVVIPVPTYASGAAFIWPIERSIDEEAPGEDVSSPAEQSRDTVQDVPGELPLFTESRPDASSNEVSEVSTADNPCSGESGSQSSGLQATDISGIDFDEVAAMFASARNSVVSAGDVQELDLQSATVYSEKDRQRILLLFSMAVESIELGEETPHYVEAVAISEGRVIENTALVEQLGKIEKHIDRAVSQGLHMGRAAGAPEETHTQEELPSYTPPQLFESGGVVRRAVAFLIDTSLVVSMAVITALYFEADTTISEYTRDLLASDFSATFTIVSLVIASVLPLAFTAFTFLCCLFRTTPGTKCAGLTILTSSGHHPAALHMFVRSMLFPISLLVLGWLPLVWKKTPLYDLMARTRVMRRRT